MLFKRLASLTCAAAIIAAFSGLAAGTASAATTLQGAGSTLVAPLEAIWATTWAQQSGNPAPTYQSVGSGQGLTDIAKGLVDFGASDAPLSASSTPCTGCVQIPWALTATGVTFNIPGVHRLHLTGSVLARIYLGKITNWSDPAIKGLNPGVALPNLAITPVHRADGSGDSYAFTDYLSSISGAWRGQVGKGTKPSFPKGPGATGNSGMVTTVQNTPGAIAYVAVSYLIAHQMPAVAIRNAAGRYEVPNLKNIANAANSVKAMPSDNELHIVNPPKSSKIAYPISTFTYAILQPSDPLGNGSLLKQYVSYALNAGQAFGPRLDFVPLPRFIKSADVRTLVSTH